MIRIVPLAVVLVLVGCGQSEPLPSAFVTTPTVEAPSPSVSPSDVVASTPSGSPLAYGLSCGPMDRVECEAYAARIAADVAERHPDMTLVSISISGPNGGFLAEFDDGTFMATSHQQALTLYRTGQLLYTPPNANVPESERPNPDHVICPNREPCGP